MQTEIMNDPAAEQRGIKKPTHRRESAPQRGGELTLEEIKRKVKRVISYS
jgi:hypothetical protein